MENKFITITDAYGINNKAINEVFKSLRRPITTEAEYILWVREFKEVNAELVRAIQAFRALKNRYKQDMAFRNTTVTTANQFWLHKKTLGMYASILYDLRSGHKASLKAGEYPKTQTEAA